jgi:hypothetical protein
MKTKLEVARKALKQNIVQWKGMILCLQTHGTNLNIPWLLENFQKQIDKNDTALQKLDSMTEENCGTCKHKAWDYYCENDGIHHKIKDDSFCSRWEWKSDG